MATREIDQAEWTSFFDAFSRQHNGWLVTIEATGTEIGPKIERQNLRLRRLTWQPQESVISVALETQTLGHLTHIVARPTHVRVEQASTGADTALQIQSIDASSTLIRFRSAALPESLDGLAPEERA